MKVITPGKTSFEHSCTGNGNGNKGCGAMLEIDREDLRYFPYYDGYMKTLPEAVVFKCPCCGATTDIAKSLWPVGHTNLTKWTSTWRDTMPGDTTSWC